MGSDCFVDIDEIVDHLSSNNELRREVIVCFVDIGGNVDYHCSNFLFIIIMNIEYLGKLVFIPPFFPQQSGLV